MDTDTAQLWARLAPELTTYFEQHLPNPGDAEDFVSVTFLNFMELDAGEHPERLIRKIAKRRLVDEYRSRGVRRDDLDVRRWPGVSDRAALSLREQVEKGTLAEHPFAHADEQMFTTTHDGALRALDPTKRDAYILMTMRGLTEREAGPLLGVHPVTANVRREAASAHIRKEIAA